MAGLLTAQIRLINHYMPLGFPSPLLSCGVLRATFIFLFSPLPGVSSIVVTDTPQSCAAVLSSARQRDELRPFSTASCLRRQFTYFVTVRASLRAVLPFFPGSQFAKYDV